MQQNFEIEINDSIAEKLNDYLSSVTIVHSRRPSVVLYILININKLFTLETLNYRIRFFDCKSTKSSNCFLSFTQDALQKDVFICSASEMKFLLENLGLMIGDLVPENNKAWDLYLTLREMHCLL